MRSLKESTNKPQDKKEKVEQKEKKTRSKKVNRKTSSKGKYYKVPTAADIATPTKTVIVAPAPRLAILLTKTH